MSLSSKGSRANVLSALIDIPTVIILGLLSFRMNSAIFQVISGSHNITQRGIEIRETGTMK